MEKTIFEYDNYREYLKDVYLRWKAKGAKFSFRYFSRLAGFQSPNFLKLVMDGERNLAGPSIEKVSKALKLNKEEAQFFRDLVLFNQAKTSDEKRIHAEMLLRSKAFRKTHPLRESEFNYYSQWYFVPIRELVGMPGFIEDPEWIAKQLNPAITATDAKKALSELEKLGLLRRDAKGQLQLSDRNVETGNEVTSLLVAQYHREMLSKAAESIDRFPRDRRDISAVTIGVTAEAMQKIKELIQNVRREIIEISSQATDPTQVYQLGFQFFPLTNDIGGQGVGSSHENEKKNRKV